MPAMNGGAWPFISGYQSQELSARYVEVIGIYPFIIVRTSRDYCKNPLTGKPAIASETTRMC